MKLRHGFVSNSSTSSFLCCVCGTMEAGSDSCGMSEYGFCRCENEHEMCIDHRLDGAEEVSLEQMKKYVLENVAEDEEFKEMTDQDIKEAYEDNAGQEDSVYDFSSRFCPVCQMKSIEDEKLQEFILKKLGVSREDVVAEIQKTYKDYDEFEAAMKEAKKEVRQ